MRKLSIGSVRSVGGVLLAFGLAVAACGASGTSVDGASGTSVDGGPDAAVAPPCPLDGGQVFETYAVCGHCPIGGHGPCETGYHCSCEGVCRWNAFNGPDANPGCVPDAGVTDAAPFEAR